MARDAMRHLLQRADELLLDALGARCRQSLQEGKHLLLLAAEQLLGQFGDQVQARALRGHVAWSGLGQGPRGHPAQGNPTKTKRVATGSTVVTEESSTVPARATRTPPTLGQDFQFELDSPRSGPAGPSRPRSRIPLLSGGLLSRVISHVQLARSFFPARFCFTSHVKHTGSFSLGTGPSCTTRSDARKRDGDA